MRPKDIAWQAIFEKYDIYSHDFDLDLFEIDADQIKAATSHFEKTGQREVRILCKQDNSEDRPSVFKERGLFILPVKNGKFVILRGEGYVDIPPINETTQIYSSKLDFPLITSSVGNSEMQHLDYAFATSIIRTFMDDPTLVLTIRGRKYTPEFSFNVGKHSVTVKSVQTEVDGGYEGSEQVVLIEAKNSSATNTIIRQLYYPFRQWSHHVQQSVTNKSVSTVFFEKHGNTFKLWQFRFNDEYDYNSITLVRAQNYQVIK